jgi:hypothetical protein
VLGEWTDNRVVRGLATRHNGHGEADRHAPAAPIASIWQPPISRLAQEPEHIRRAAMEQWRKMAETDS